MSPQHFDWAKKFLASKAWELLLTCTDKSAMMAFAIPSSCPSSSLLLCISQPEEVGTTPSKDDIPGEPEPVEQRCSKKARVRMGGREIPECESSVRRSDRIKAKSGGFHKTSCHDKSCLACNVLPPTITSANIQNLEDKVCAIDPTKTSYELLSTKAAPQKTIGDRKGKDPIGTPRKGKTFKTQGSSSSATALAKSA